MLGQVFQLPIEGEGDAEAQFRKYYLVKCDSFNLDYIFFYTADTKISSIMRGIKVQKNGKEYLNLETIDFKILSYSHFTFYLHELFPGNPELTQTVNKLLDDHRDEFAVEVVPLLEDVISKVYFSFFKGVFDKFSLDELFA